jgi:hypothetical protein
MEMLARGSGGESKKSRAEAWHYESKTTSKAREDGLKHRYEGPCQLQAGSHYNCVQTRRLDLREKRARHAVPLREKTVDVT